MYFTSVSLESKSHVMEATRDNHRKKQSMGAMETLRVERQRTGAGWNGVGGITTEVVSMSPLGRDQPDRLPVRLLPGLPLLSERRSEADYNRSPN